MKNMNRIKELLDAVKNRGEKSLSSVFIELSDEWNLKKNTVRNIYYNAINQIRQDSIWFKTLGITLDDVPTFNVVRFTSREKNKLYNYVESRVKEGSSVRHACIELAKGDVNLMLRYQNKYRSLKKKYNGANSENDLQKMGKDFNDGKVVDIKELKKQSKLKKLLVDKKVILSEENKSNMQNVNKEETNEIYGKIPENVIPFRRKENILTDKELQSLFLGLVRIVKSSAVAEVDEIVKKQCNLQAIEIRNLLKNLKSAREELSQAKIENNRLKKELEMVLSSKAEDYAKFMKKIKESQSISTNNRYLPE